MVLVSTNITREAIEQTVQEALVELGVEPELITPDATLESLEIDSLDLVELAQIVEEQHGIKITAEDARGIQTVSEAIDMIVGLADGGAPSAVVATMP